MDPSKEKYFPTWPNIPQNKQQSGLNKIPLSVKTNGFDLKAEQVGHGLSLGGQDTATGAWGSQRKCTQDTPPLLLIQFALQ